MTESTAPMNVLLVEDETEFRELAAQWLARQGHSIVEAANGQEALREIQRRNFDVVVCDMNMPGISGMEVLERLKSSGSEAQVVILTGQATVENAVAAMKIGAIDYLTKPFPLAELERRCQRACEARFRLEEQLQEKTRDLVAVDRNKDEFLGMLAHELRTPLGTIRNAIQIMQHPDSASENDFQWAQEVIGRQAEHMSCLIEDLLDVSRIANGKVRVRKVPVELGQIIAQAIETAKPLLNVKKQRLIVSTPSTPISLMADRTRLLQILNNLLNNAAKYTDEEGEITLTVAQEQDDVVICIQDTGIGIAAEMLPSIFDLFAQIPDALELSEGGLGIGLAMVNHLVQSHGGTVKAFSEGTGLGSRFVVRLPILNP